MSVEKRGAAYLVRWRDSSGKQRSKTVTRKRDADALDGEMKRKRAMGELITHERGNIQLQDFWEVWWQNYATVNLTQRTRENYSQIYRTHIRPALGRTQIRRIGGNDVAEWLAGITQRLAPSSSRKCVAVLQSVLQRAVEWEYIARNPAQGVRKARLVQRRGRAIQMNEVAALCAELDLRSATLVQTLAGTGMRPGELRALLWGDVGDDRITITKAVSSNQIGPTKTGAARAARPSGAASAALREWALACGRPAAEVLAFPGANGRLWTDNGWRLWQQKVFAPAAARAGLAGLRPYDLRHTYASQRIAAGADILTLASQLGHSPTMTLTVYGHLLGGRDGDNSRGGLRASVPTDDESLGA